MTSNEPGEELDEPVVRQLRVTQKLWDEFGRIAGLRGRSPVLVSFIRWYVGDGDARLPQRPKKRGRSDQE